MKKVNFSEVFGEIYTKYGKELESLRKDALNKCIVTLIGIAFIDFLLLKLIDYSELEILLIMLSILLYIFLCGVISSRYTTTFKQKAIRTLVENSNNTFEYNAKYGMSSSEYNESGFDRTWDEFKSEDGISGNLGSMVSFKMSEVETIEITRTKNGTTRTTTFLGLYGIIQLPVKSRGKLDILGDSILRKFKDARINLESQEFEKNYDVLADDKIWALQVLNSEAIENFIEMRNFFKKSISIKIRDNEIYFRLSCEKMFEPKLFSSVNFDVLYKYFRIIDIPRFIYDNLIDNIARVSENEEFKNEIKFDEKIEENSEILQNNNEEEEQNWFATKVDDEK